MYKSEKHKAGDPDDEDGLARTKALEHKKEGKKHKHHKDKDGKCIECGMKMTKKDVTEKEEKDIDEEEEEE